MVNAMMQVRPTDNIGGCNRNFHPIIRGLADFQCQKLTTAGYYPMRIIYDDH